MSRKRMGANRVFQFVSRETVVGGRWFYVQLFKTIHCNIRYCWNPPWHATVATNFLHFEKTGRNSKIFKFRIGKLHLFAEFKNRYLSEGNKPRFGAMEGIINLRTRQKDILVIVKPGVTKEQVYGYITIREQKDALD